MSTSKSEKVLSFFLIMLQMIKIVRINQVTFHY